MGRAGVAFEYIALSIVLAYNPQMKDICRFN